MKRYEGLYVLNTAGKEENVKEAIDKICDEIKANGGKVEGIQKMDKKPFARGGGDLREGYYLNIIFSGPAKITGSLRAKLSLSELIFRQLYTIEAPPPPVRAKPLAETKAQPTT